MRLSATRRQAWLVLAVAVLSLLSAPTVRAALAPAARGPATAHVSYSSWTIDGASVRMDFMLPRTAAVGLVAPGAPRPDTAAVAGAVAANVAVQSAGGACEAIDQGEEAGRIYVLAQTPRQYRFEIIFACPEAAGLVLHDGLLFARFPDHVNYAQVRVDGGPPVIQLFTRNHQSLALTAGRRAPQASLLRFAMQGASQLIRHADRLCIILGLLLLARRWRDLGLIAAALAAGYLASVVLTLGGFGLSNRDWGGATTGLAALLLGAGALRLRPSGPAAPRAWRIATIAVAGLVFAAVMAVAAMMGPSAALAVGGLALFGGAQVWIAGSDPRLRWIAFAPGALFALMDGMGLAEDLAALQTPTMQAAPRLLAHGFGVVAAAWLSARKLATAKRTLAVDLAAASLVGLGLFWFVSRIYGY